MTRSLFLSALLLCCSPPGFPAQVNSSSATDAFSEVRLEALVAAPESFDQKPVKLRGRVQLIGRNYFIEPKFAVEDGLGNRVGVTTWVPLEVPPLPPGEGINRVAPRTMAYYLGKTVLIRGVYSAREARIAVDSAAETQLIQEAAGQRNGASPGAPKPKPSLPAQAVAPGIHNPSSRSPYSGRPPTVASPTGSPVKATAPPAMPADRQPTSGPLPVTESQP